MVSNRVKIFHFFIFFTSYFVIKLLILLYLK